MTRTDLQPSCCGSCEPACAVNYLRLSVHPSSASSRCEQTATDCHFCPFSNYAFTLYECWVPWRHVACFSASGLHQNWQRSSTDAWDSASGGSACLGWSTCRLSGQRPIFCDCCHRLITSQSCARVQDYRPWSGFHFLSRLCHQTGV